MDAGTRRIYRELMELVNAAEPTAELEPEPVPAEPRVEYDRRLGAAKMRAEIDRYFLDFRAFDEEESEVQTSAPTPLPLPEFVDPETLRIRPDNLEPEEAARWSSWEWAVKFQFMKNTFIPSPAEIEYMTRLSTMYGIETLTAYSENYVGQRKPSKRRKRSKNHGAISRMFRDAIAGLELSTFTADDLAVQLPTFNRSFRGLMLDRLTKTKTPCIRRISESPITYERLPYQASARCKPRNTGSRARPTKEMWDMQNSAAENAR